MRPLWEAVDFCQAIRRRLRFGELSRSPLRLLRLEVRGGAVECEWMARAADVWDAELRARTRNCNASLQALHDALAMRDLIFSEMAEVQTATLRAYRGIDGHVPELIIAGIVERGAVAPRGIRSLAMRAKLEGLRFWLDDGILEALQQEEQAGNSRCDPVFV